MIDAFLEVFSVTKLKSYKIIDEGSLPTIGFDVVRSVVVSGLCCKGIFVQ